MAVRFVKTIATVDAAICAVPEIGSSSFRGLLCLNAFGDKPMSALQRDGC